ncbi:hypothetical protein ACH347_19435 [Saccharopolyspora sp. 5N102]|uniref:hypothetical protein n=1 Tax=Saccharopolyspora sp. 5N102 TaxID=3375155 RepID=UPI0037AA253B
MSRITGNGVRSGSARKTCFGTALKGAPGTDMIGVLQLGAAEQKADDAKNALNAAADRHGFATCGSAIDWRY